MKKAEIIYCIECKNFKFVFGGKRIPSDHPDIFAKFIPGPAGTNITQFFRDAKCSELLHQTSPYQPV